MNKFEELKKLKENGKFLTKKDLTYEILYTLSIEEGVIDNNIAELFNMTKNQVIYLRKKYNLQNIFAKKMVIDIENMLNVPQISNSNLTLTEKYKASIEGLLLYISSKKWRKDVVIDYLVQKSESTPELKTALIELGYFIDKNYSITIKNSKHIGTKLATKKRNNNGKKINQIEAAKNKIKAGTLGEKLAYDFEVSKLQDLGLSNLIPEVDITTKTEEENVTFDGLGYDVVSFNELGEKIYIEAKCSTTNNSNNIIFNISQKEVNLMNGKLKNIDKEHAFIYYFYNINKREKTADLFIIDYTIFSTYTLKPTAFKVEEIYQD